MGILDPIKKIAKAPFKIAKKIIKAPINLAKMSIEHTQNTLDSIKGMFSPEINFPEEKDVMPMPDQEEQIRLARRSAARRRGGAASTILTGYDDPLG